MNHADEFCEICRHLSGQPPGVDVVAACSEKDLLGLVREDEAVGKVGGIHDFRATKAAVDGRVIREIDGERFPEPDRRGADKEDSTLGRRLLAIRRFICGDFFFEFRVVVRGRVSAWGRVLAG